MVCNVIHFIRLSSHLPSLHKLYTEPISVGSILHWRVCIPPGYLWLYRLLLSIIILCVKCFILHTIYGLTAVGDADFRGLDIAAVAGLLKLFLVQTHSMNIAYMCMDEYINTWKSAHPLFAFFCETKLHICTVHTTANLKLFIFWSCTYSGCIWSSDYRGYNS